jgi:hypothetical protein
MSGVMKRQWNRGHEASARVGHVKAQTCYNSRRALVPVRRTRSLREVCSFKYNVKLTGLLTRINVSHAAISCDSQKASLSVIWAFRIHLGELARIGLTYYTNEALQKPPMHKCHGKSPVGDGRRGQ